MKRHRGNTLMGVMIAIALSSIPLLIVSQFTGLVVSLSVNESAYVVSQRGISAVIYDIQRDIKSATQMETSEGGTTLSLISDTSYVKYAWADDALYRTESGETELMVDQITGVFVVDDATVTITYILNGTEQSVTIYGEAIQ